MPNLALTKPSADELLAGANSSGAVLLSATLKNEIIAGLAPPVIPPNIPPGDVDAQIRAAAAAQGLRPMIYHWDWAARSLTPPSSYGGTTIQTQNDAQGPLGSNGVVVVVFTVPASAQVGAVGSVQVSGWSNTGSQNRTTAISLNPVDFNPPPPSIPPSPNDSTWVRGPGSDAGIGFCVGHYPRAGMFCPLAPGQQYFLNILSSPGPAMEIRVTLTAP